ncbi:hypothetical protein KAFR_0C05740 [Kazachstania africana CBS 2517]|uniref:FAD dependent oxidoreductase domain-containing protein n=1 Tax=Kazachstania africana (strain ATCC 22294 / BCRC 22015 / CBS 2517 / CECT 1963 / NBRC 1671 / NRRL Y-8276) TaxID=1071382 RepID=H2AT65_KAZAF|nr:hypothetical protein KAFR_0C05740 [Kazachstania africana CBS 2517]CCF57565.1 hypothetical protein KAFR_0C05740 [Kazachstania africana CBS 2517]
MPNENKKEIVIVGAGIIGCTTAYYLTTHPAFSRENHHITIIESNNVACGASGKAGGLLASWAFPSQIGELSFRMHKELAKKFHGDEKWDYRVLDTISIEADIRNELGDDEELLQERGYNLDVDMPKKSNKFAIQGDPSMESIDSLVDDVSSCSSYSTVSTGSYSSASSSSASNSVSLNINHDDRMKGRNPLPRRLKWIKRKLVDDWSTLGDAESTAQVQPYKFTHFVLEKAMESGAVDLIYGKVSDIIKKENSNEATGVSYIPVIPKSHNTPSSVSDTVIDINDVDEIIITAGPWTSRLLPDCPISGLRAHSITIEPEDIKKVTPYAIFTELRTGDTEYFSPEIYARKDEVYVCGEGDTLVELPDATQDVEVSRLKCQELFRYASKLSKNLSNGKINASQACYLPVLNVATSSGPLIGETNMKNLYLASGHSCWGINNAPATGKLLSEIIFDGSAQSAKIDKLNPKLYFDASI